MLKSTDSELVILVCYYNKFIFFLMNTGIALLFYLLVQIANKMGL
jgi:hypothetical protein